MANERTVFYLSTTYPDKALDSELNSLFSENDWDADYLSYFNDPTQKGIVFCLKEEVEELWKK